MKNIVVTNKKDIFDILGISSKEDSFTDLLAETFNSSGNQEFRTSFCKVISNGNFLIQNSSDCTICTRRAFKVNKTEQTGYRSKVLPDMLVVSPSQNAVVIIENKIFSSEGYQQTIAYSSAMFMDELKKWLKDDYHMNGEVQVEFYYLTLLGEKAESNNFKSLKWTELIIETCKGKEFISPFNILMEDLLSRAVELKDFIEKPIVIEKSFDDYYSHQNRWVNSKIVFEKVFSSILNELTNTYNGNLEYTVTKANSNVEQFLIVLSADGWKRHSLVEYKKGDPINEFEYTRNIHVEFSWIVGNRDASMYIHYETNPYYPQKKFRLEFPEIEPMYLKHRECFKRGIEKEIVNSKSWKQANTVLALANTRLMDFSKKSIEEIHLWFRLCFEEAYEMIAKKIEEESL